MGTGLVANSENRTPGGWGQIVQVDDLGSLVVPAAAWWLPVQGVRTIRKYKKSIGFHSDFTALLYLFQVQILQFPGGSARLLLFFLALFQALLMVPVASVCSCASVVSRPGRGASALPMAVKNDF